MWEIRLDIFLVVRIVLVVVQVRKMPFDKSLFRYSFHEKIIFTDGTVCIKATGWLIGVQSECQCKEGTCPDGYTFNGKFFLKKWREIYKYKLHSSIPININR